MTLRATTDRVALVKMEAAYGVDSAPTAASAMMLMESSISPEADKLERKVDRAFFGGNPFVLVGKRVTLSAKCDVLGAAVAGQAAPLGPLYRITGHKEVLSAAAPVGATYSPISRNFESATVYFYQGGMWFKMTGVRGSLDFDFSIKQYAMGTIKLTGLLGIPADGEAPVGIDYTAFQTPAAIETESWEVTVQSGAGPIVNVCAQQLSLTSGTDVKIQECSNAREVTISDRKPTGTLKVFKDSLLAVWNPFDIANAQQIVTITNTITKSAGLNVVMPIRAQLEYPKIADIDGVIGYEIPYTAVPSGAGGDEYALTFS